MISFYQRTTAIAIVLFIGIMLSFCATKNFLTVKYQLPPQPAEQKEIRVALVVKDVREDRSIATKNARAALQNFTDHFALIVAQENKNDKLVGAFSPSSLLKEVFKQRLENAGIVVAAEEDPSTPVVEIVLKEFKLNLENRKWIVTMSYQANLIKQNAIVAGETITGSAERLRVIGSKDAEIVVGELISDVANRLNLKELLQI
jgi:uncharacterized lipoprotein YajG